MTKYRLRSFVVALFALMAAFTLALPASAATNNPGPATFLPNQATGCSPATATWFHIYRSGGDECVGRMGITPVPGGSATPATGFCGGNNVGFFSGHYGNGVPSGNHSFGMGTTEYIFLAQNGYPDNDFFIESVTITKWNGSDTCQQ